MVKAGVISQEGNEYCKDGREMLTDDMRKEAKNFARMLMEEEDKMEHVISNEEINDIMCAINEGGPEKLRKIQLYDFCRPDRFLGYMSAISYLHKILAKSWESLFPRHLQKDIHINLESADALNYDEFTRCLPNPTFLLISQGFLDSAPLPLPFVIEVDPILSIEQSILNDMSKSLLDEYAQVWNEQYGMKLEFNLKSTEANLKQIKIDLPMEMGILITMSVKINDKEGMINIYLPYSFMKPLLSFIPKERSSGRMFDNINQKEDIMEDRYKSAIETGLDNVKVQVVVELGRAVKTLKEIKETQEGSIMEIKDFSQCVDLFVNNVLFGRGEVCVVDENFAVRVTEILGYEENAQNAAPAEGEND